MSLEVNKFPSSISHDDSQLKVIQLIKSVNNKYVQEIKEDNTIDKSLLLGFKKLFNGFTYELYQLTQLIDADATGNYNIFTPQLASQIDSVISNWNNVVIFLANKLQYSKLSSQNKNYIDSKFSALSPSVKKIVGNFQMDIRDGHAKVTSQRMPSKSLFNLLYQLSDKLNNNDYTLIIFKVKLGKYTPLEPEEEEEEEEEDEEEEEEDEEDEEEEE